MGQEFLNKVIEALSKGYEVSVRPERYIGNPDTVDIEIRVTDSEEMRPRSYAVRLSARSIYARGGPDAAYAEAVDRCVFRLENT